MTESAQWGQFSEKSESSSFLSKATLNVPALFTVFSMNLDVTPPAGLAIDEQYLKTNIFLCNIDVIFY